MTTQELITELTTIISNFLAEKEHDSGYNLEVATAQQLLVILNGYPWE
jgi:hypothetical protein